MGPMEHLTQTEINAVRRMLEVHAIEEVMLGYARAIDRNDADLMKTIFWEDGFDDHGMYKGTASGWMERARTNRDLITSRYHIVGPAHVLAFEGAQARVETYFHYIGVFPQADGRDKLGELTGRFRDVFEKRDGVWKVLRRVVVFDASSVQPYEPAWTFFNIPEGINRGGVEPLDATYEVDW